MLFILGLLAPALCGLTCLPKATAGVLLAPPPPTPPSTNGTNDFGFQINYFTDRECSNFNRDFNPTLDGCYNYAYTGTRSAALVNWNSSPGSKPHCTFYSDYDCTGASQDEVNNDCSNQLVQYMSVLCTYGT
jgi:hypothetical protein